MLISNELRKRHIVSSVIVSTFVLLLSSCAGFPSSLSNSNATNADVQSGDASRETSDEDPEMSTMRDDCMAMHEEMKAKMSEGGMMEGGKKMSPEMKEKHQQCMKLMPQIREEMHERCMKKMKEKAAGDMANTDGKDKDAHMKSMHQHCKMMTDNEENESDGSVTGDER